MSDFTQGPQWANFPTGETYYGDVTMDDDIIQPSASGDFADYGAMQESVDPNYGSQGTVFEEHPGRFITQTKYRTEQKSVSRQLVGGVIVAATADIIGFNLTENAGAAASVTLYSGIDSNGFPIAAFKLTANETKFFPLTYPIYSKNGIFAVLTGSVIGSVYTLEDYQ